MKLWYIFKIYSSIMLLQCSFILRGRFYHFGSYLPTDFKHIFIHKIFTPKFIVDENVHLIICSTVLHKGRVLKLYVFSFVFILITITMFHVALCNASNIQIAIQTTFLQKISSKPSE